MNGFNYKNLIKNAKGPEGELLINIFIKLYKHFGPQHWWPGDSPFEVCVGAILTQNTSWKNVAKAIHNLKQNNSLSPETLHNMAPELLADMIRPAGYFNIKAQRLKNFISVLVEEFDSDLDRLFQAGLDQTRERLLAIKGIGPETADSIILYAGGLPTFVIDAYTKRILSRHSIIEDNTTYDELRRLFMDSLPNDTALFNEYHALLVVLGKDFCRKTNPLCKTCPISGM